VSSVSHTVGRIVVGVHGTPGSLQALRFAVGHARAYGATLIPVIAWQTPDSAGHRTPTYLADELASAAEQRLLTAFDEGLGGLPSDISTLPMVIRGPVGPVLVNVAERDSDILVVGQSNHGILRRVLFGSPAHYCVKHARSSVILVPPTQLAVELRRQRYSRSLG
jgi:nucleotide-binding universal stress UspA family protein